MIPAKKILGLPASLAAIGTSQKAFDASIPTAPLAKKVSVCRRRFESRKLRTEFLKPTVAAAVMGTDFVECDVG